MGEIEFIIITLIFVTLILLIVNRIITRYNRQKRIVPHEDFNGELNNLEKIIEGVSLKDEDIEEEIENQTEDTEDKEKDEGEIEVEEEPSKKKRPRRVNKSLKNAIINKEILTPKHNK